MQELTLEQLQQVSGGANGTGTSSAGPNEPGSGDRDIGAPPLNP